MFWLIVGAGVFGLVASAVVYRASGMRPVWSIVTALIVVLVLAAAAFAILMLAKASAFP
jgi:hypothetical protein